MRESNDVLEGVVFEDVEVGLGEILDEMAVVVDDRAIEDDLVDVAGEGVDAVLALRLLVGGGVGRTDGRVVGSVGRDDGIAVNVEGRLGFRELRGRNDGGCGRGCLGRSRLGSGGCR
jgi:hypothetical protein